MAGIATAISYLIGKVKKNKKEDSMGNSSSHAPHEPLDRSVFQRGVYGDVKNTKSASFRFSKRSPKKMDRIRQSFRDSFRRRKNRVPEASKPHQWQADEQAVRSATCSFAVKYLGCVEVFESRGMSVCEEALKILRNSRRRPVRGLLHVSGDGLRVVDDDTKGLIVDQTIEKVSFCAPDRNHERGFSYICRDGTTRRWMCHGFLASKDSGERLSHAVGCAFAVCLERKQRRDKECGVTMTFDMKNSTFTRSGSFRQQSITERLANNDRSPETPSAVVPPQPKPFNPFAIERPHATPHMLERQGSFRGLGQIGATSPFKRQMSLRLNDLPSNAERQKAFLNTPKQIGGDGVGRSVSPIPEVAAASETVSQLCQELSQGLSLLTTTDDDFNFNNTSLMNKNSSVNAAALLNTPSPTDPIGSTSSTQIIAMKTTTSTLSPQNEINNQMNTVTTTAICATTQSNSSMLPVQPITNNIPQAVVLPQAGSMSTPPPIGQISPRHRASIAGASPSAQKVMSIESNNSLPKPDQWLGEVVKNTSPSLKQKAPPLAIQSRAKSMSAAAVSSDPFDAEWVVGVTKPESTNPFISSPTAVNQTFRVQL